MPKSRLNEGCQFAQVEGLLKYFDNYYVDAFGGGCYGGALVLVVAIIPAQYYYRYRCIVNTDAPSILFTSSLLMAAVASASITAYFGYFAWGYSGMIKPGFNYGPLWYLEQPLPRVLVQDFNSVHSQHYIHYITSSLIVSYAIAIYYGVKTYKLMNANHLNESAKTKAMQKQLTKTLVIQTIVPLFVSFGPTFLMCFAIATKQNTSVYSMYLVWFASWIPTINSLTTIWVIVPFRRQTFLRWQKKAVISDISLNTSNSQKTGTISHT